jgi:uncharacterized Zn finger protein
MNMIPSPLSLDLTNTRAFKTWLYQLWQSTGGTTSTAIEDIDLYLSSSNNDNDTAQLDQVLLLQIRDELSEINKKLDEIQINERTALDDVNKKLDEIQINERTALDDVNKKIDEIQINERTALDDVNKKIDDLVLLLGGAL